MLTLSIVARLPLAMFSIGLLVHAQRLTGSFAAAGLVMAAYAVALGVGGPVLGRLVDRRGQTVILLGAASVSATLLCAIAVVPEGAPVPLLVVLASGIGLATPPVGACLRTLLRDPAAFAVEASAVELTWVCGPPLVLSAGALFSTGAALAGAGLLLLASTAAFAAHPSSRAWRPAARVTRPRGGSLRTPAMQTLALVLLCVGVLFGAVEIGVAAASNALGATAAAGPLLGVWGVGSLAGGALAARAARRDATPGRRTRPPRTTPPSASGARLRAVEPRPCAVAGPSRAIAARLRAVAGPSRAIAARLRAVAGPSRAIAARLRAVAGPSRAIAARLRAVAAPLRDLAPLRGGSRLTALLVALTAAHLLLVVAAGSVYALAAVLFLAGAAIAPTYAAVFALVERAAPAGTVTEAFAWLATAVAVGSAAGAATAGAIAEHVGPAAVFAFAGVAGATALAATLSRSATVAACQTS